MIAGEAQQWMRRPLGERGYSAYVTAPVGQFTAPHPPASSTFVALGKPTYVGPAKGKPIALAQTSPVHTSTEHLWGAYSKNTLLRTQWEATSRPEHPPKPPKPHPGKHCLPALLDRQARAIVTSNPRLSIRTNAYFSQFLVENLVERDGDTEPREEES
jgi:hypothetical protein